MKTRVSDYQKRNRFFDFLIGTKVYSDLYSSKEAFISFILSALACGMLFHLQHASGHDWSWPKDLIGILLVGEFGLLGFLISGLALLVGSIGFSMIRFFDQRGGFNQLLAIIFRFYFVGAIIGLTIVLLICDYVLLSAVSTRLDLMQYALTAFSTYLVSFGLISSIMLMGSCIRLMILKYQFQDQKSSK